MAGKGMAERMRALNDLQRSGALDPGNMGRLPKMKGTTGKRLSPKEKADQRKQREKELRRRKRELKNPGEDRGEGQIGMPRGR
jgi:signal recognition particle subunit SRP54